MDKPIEKAGRIRLICAAIGGVILPTFDLADRLLWHAHVSLSGLSLPLPLVILICVVCPGLPLIAIYSEAGANGAFSLVYSLACLIDGAWFALIGPPFLKLAASIKESVFSNGNTRG